MSNTVQNKKIPKSMKDPVFIKMLKGLQMDAFLQHLKGWDLLHNKEIWCDISCAKMQMQYDLVQMDKLARAIKNL